MLATRILANRQSAQRSRVRKLQYISELERCVSSLQVFSLPPPSEFFTVKNHFYEFHDSKQSINFFWIIKAEVSVLSPRVAFLDHQRLLLNVDNSALKQRIAALAQDKIFKDGI